MDGLKRWQSGVVYQIYPRSFCDSNGDGIGDIGGIIGKLDYIKALGADYIWLSPVYCSPNDDNGYDISDYRDINPEYGTLEDMDRLIQKAKEQGIGIIMDLVINHTSDEHWWFKASKRGEGKYKDYYVWKSGDKYAPPNNWTSFFTGTAWEWCEERGEYYLHLFSKRQPDLNWDNPDVYSEIKDILTFWLDRGVAGFRCDVINVIHKKDYGDGVKKGGVTGADKFVSTDGCHDILRRLNADVFSRYDCYTVGETVFVDTGMANDLCAPARGELDTVFGFEHMETDQISHKWFKTRFKPAKFMRVIERWQRGLYWNANYFENHDQPRSITRFLRTDNPAHAKTLAMLLLCLKGTPFIFEGQEIGMTNGDFKNLNEIRDVESHYVDRLARKMLFPKVLRWKLIRRTSRDNARTPMQWNGEDGAGFTSGGNAWLKINANHKTINVQSQQSDPDSLLSFYKRLIAYRKGSDILLKGEFHLLYANNKMTVFERALNGKKLIIACNFTGKPVYLKDLVKNAVLSTHPNQDFNGTLMPYGAVIIQPLA